MKNKRRIAILLIGCMLFSMLPTAAFAEEETQETQICETCQQEPCVCKPIEEDEEPAVELEKEPAKAPEVEPEEEPVVEPTKEASVEAAVAEPEVSEEEYGISLLADEGEPTDEENFRAAIAQGGTVELDKDVTVTEIITISGDVTINLNGHKIISEVTYGRTFTLTGGTLTINGTVEGSGMEIPEENTDCYGFIKVEGESTIIMNGGTYTGNTSNGAFIKTFGEDEDYALTLDLDDITVKTNYRFFTGGVTLTEANFDVDGGHFTTGSTTFVVDAYGGNLKFDGVTVVVDNETTYGGVIEVSGPNAVFTDCDFNVKYHTTANGYSWCNTAVAVSYEGTAVINGGNYASEGYGVYVFSSGGTITIDKADVSGGVAAICASTDSYYGTPAEIIVNSGNFSGAIQTYGDVQRTVTINGGTFENFSVNESNPTKSNITISDGTFDADVSAYFDNDELMQDPSGKVIEGTDGPKFGDVAAIGNVGYTSLQEAVTAAVDGDTITVLADVTLTSQISLSKNVTFKGVEGSKPTITLNTTEGRGFITDHTEGRTVTFENLKMVAAKEGLSFIYQDGNIARTITVNNCEFTMAEGITTTGSVLTSYITTEDNTGKVIFTNNKVDLLTGSVLPGLGNGSVVTGNEFVLRSDRIITDKTTRTGVISLAKSAASATVTGNVFQGANRVLAVDSTSKITGETLSYKNNAFINCLWAFELNPATQSGFDLSENYYCYNGEVGALRVEDSEGGSGSDKHLNGSSEYKYTESGSPAIVVSSYYTDEAMHELEDLRVAEVNGVKYLTLQDAINAAWDNADVTVTLLKDVTVETWYQNLYKQGHSVTKGPDALNIDGAGHTLTVNRVDSLSNGNRLFYGAKNLNVSNLNIVLGAACNGAFSLSDSTLTNVSITGGGAGYGILTGSNVTVTDCTFANVAHAIYTEEKGCGTGVKVTGCTFDCKRAMILRSDEEFTGNTIKASCVEGITVNTTATSTITGNTFEAGGGDGSRSMKLYQSNATVSGNKILGNVQFASDVTSASLDGNYWGGELPTLPDGVTIDTWYTTDAMSDVITLSAATQSLQVGGAFTLTVSGDLTGKVEWTSDNTAVATVEDGKVTAVAAGTAAITAKVGDVSATCTVTVTNTTAPSGPSGDSGNGSGSTGPSSDPGSSSGSSGGGSSGGGGSTVRPTVTPAPAPAEEDLEEEEVPLAQPMRFTDVSEKDWFYDAVRFVFDRDMMKGMDKSGTVFAPNLTATRGMIVTILYRLEKEPGAYDAAFTDVANGDWYAAAVRWAAANGVVKGYEDNTFRANGVISREEMAVILARYAKLKGLDVTTQGDMRFYNDRTIISSWARDNMSWAVGVKLLSGRDNGLLDPKGVTTRAEAAQMLKNFCEKVLVRDNVKK